MENKGRILGTSTDSVCRNLPYGINIITTASIIESLHTMRAPFGHFGPLGKKAKPATGGRDWTDLILSSAVLLRNYPQVRPRRREKTSGRAVPSVDDSFHPVLARRGFLAHIPMQNPWQEIVSRHEAPAGSGVEASGTRLGYLLRPLPRTSTVKQL